MSLLSGLGDFFSGGVDMISDAFSSVGGTVDDIASVAGDVSGDVGASVLDEFPGLSDPSAALDDFQAGGIQAVGLDSFESQLSDWGFDANPIISDALGGGGGGTQGGSTQVVRQLPAGVTFQQVGAFGGAAMAAGGLLARLSPTVASAIIKLSQKLGGAGGSIAGYGRKTWAALSGWAAKNPGVSLVSTLVSLGLSVEEAAHFIAWGTTQKKRRRARGVSSRDLRTTRRTMSKLNRYVAQLRHLCGPVHRSPVHHRRRA